MCSLSRNWNLKAQLVVFGGMTGQSRAEAISHLSLTDRSTRLGERKPRFESRGEPFKVSISRSLYCILVIICVFLSSNLEKAPEKIE